MTLLDRRGFLKSAPVTALAVSAAPVGAMTHEADATPGDSHQLWRTLHDQATTAWLATEEDTPEHEALWDQREKYQDLICQTTARTFEGAALQMEWLIEDAEPYWGCDNHREVAQRILTALREGLA